MILLPYLTSQSQKNIKEQKINEEKIKMNNNQQTKFMSTAEEQSTNDFSHTIYHKHLI